MAFDAFVKFTASAGASEEIKGESNDEQFKGWFEVKEFSFGIENTLNITSSSGGAGAGKAEFKEFTVKKQTDRASPVLAATCGKGGHYKEVELCLRKSGVNSAGQSGQSAGVYLKYEFKLVAVKSVEWSGSTGDDVPEETVVFEYGALRINYWPQKKDGTLGDLIQRAWNKMTNSATFDGDFA